ncbi:MAG TPA: penicillin acylase family protein [Opitutaceae bacterium]|jgi:penicillin amidase
MRAGTIARRSLLGVLAAAVLAAALAAAGALWLRGRMGATLARLDGSAALPGLSAAVTVERDALGVPTVSGSDRADVARATGWLHAQDRFFQMDILRRRGSGELSELFGRAALGLDREARMHGFRRLASTVLSREPPEGRALAQAYADGVNAGLAALGGKPWEYSVLRTRPRPWAPEDCVLVCFAMTLDLEDSMGGYSRLLADVRDQLGDASLAFFAPLYTGFDAALDGSSRAAPPIPPPDEIDLRARKAAPAAAAGAPGERMPVGSNSLAISVPGGPAIVANDMHLRLSVPNTWYRVRLRWPGHDETGITLPGTPVLVAGSTGKVAWGLTASNAGTGDLVIVSPGPTPDLYHGIRGALLAYERRNETVDVKGSKPVEMTFPWTIWGPVVAKGPKHTSYALHWAADDPAATNFELFRMEDARDAAEAADVAHRAGIPLVNVMIADSAGKIAWTLAGSLPNRVGYDGRLPVTWTFGDRRWDGFVPPGRVPTVVSPAEGYLWSANNRMLGGPAGAALGDEGYDLGARAQQLRAGLAALARQGKAPAPADLLSIELDDRAVLLARWHDILLGALTPAAVAASPGRRALLEGARKWDGTAGTGSVGYRIVHDFRVAASRRVLDPIFQACVDADPGFRWTRLNYEPGLEAILGARPAHLLSPAYSSWEELLLAATDDVCAADRKAGLDPATATWGERNTARIEHPFARMLPDFASGWLSMPRDPLPGDNNMPRVQNVSFGASERFAVSPGRESEGIFEMPGGESGNPLSPYFRAGHEAWVHGDRTPFLPGPAEHSLRLVPR